MPTKEIGPSDPLSVAMRWALALGAPLHVARAPAGAPIDLAPYERMTYPRTLRTKFLEMCNREWPPVGFFFGQKQKARRQLDWLLYEGNRAPYAFEIPENEGLAKEALAWDLVRLSKATVKAYMNGHLSIDDALYYLACTGLWAQAQFRSWGNFSEQFLSGRKLSKSIPNPALERAVKRLLDEPQSPWKELPWELNLSELERPLSRIPNPFWLNRLLERFFRRFNDSQCFMPFVYGLHTERPPRMLYLVARVHSQTDGSLEFALDVYVTFMTFEPRQDLRPALAKVLKMNAREWTPLATQASWRVRSADDWPQIETALTEQWTTRVAPYFEKLSSYEKARDALLTPEAERLWSAEACRANLEFLEKQIAKKEKTL